MGVSTSQPVSDHDSIEVVLLQEVREGEEGLSWHDRLLASDPVEGSHVSSAKLVQELSLVPSSSGGDDAIGLLDQGIGRLGLGDQLDVANGHLFKPSPTGMSCPRV